MTSRARRARPRKPYRVPPWLPTLSLAASLRFSVGQSVALRAVPAGRALAQAEETLRERGFRVSPPASSAVAKASGGAGSEGVTVRVAERDVRRGPMDRPVVEAVVALLGGGIVLGVVETLLAGTPFYAGPWVLGAALVSLALWLRYGRTFESDVIVALVRARVDAGGSGGEDLASARPASPVEVLWQTGRVRSVLHGGRRIAVRVIECHPVQVRELIHVIDQFDTRFRRSPGGVAFPS